MFQPVNEALARWNLTLVVGSGSGDVEPPTAPVGLRSVGATSSSVSLEWSAATDNVGVTGYDVFDRSWTLRIGDNGPADVGVLSGWSITV